MCRYTSPNQENTRIYTDSWLRPAQILSLIHISLDADFTVPGEKKPLKAKFYGTEKEKIQIRSKEELDKILKGLELSLIYI